MECGSRAEFVCNSASQHEDTPKASMNPAMDTFFDTKRRIRAEHYDESAAVSRKAVSNDISKHKKTDHNDIVDQFVWYTV